MVMKTAVVTIEDSSQVGLARRLATDSASRLGLPDELIGKLALIVTELGTNLIKHASGGQILFRALDGEPTGVEILSIDKGPGIHNFNRAFEDGFSTAGSPGNGLGAVARLSAEHFCYSFPGRGTIIGARVTSGGTPPDNQYFEVGAICCPIKGEEECGDSWVVIAGQTGIRAVVVDGLGHGPLAAEASEAAIRVARESPELGPADLIERASHALKATRGAALAVADIDRFGGTVRFAGVGNISGAIADQGKMRQMVSHNGTAGGQLRRLQEFTYPWTASSILLMHSDGLTARWSLDTYPELAAQHPSLVGGFLFRDFTRGRDDVTVLTVRNKAGHR
jgi:anti-sigma regulatory factor (Ser/Thr protein kinase)